MNSQLVGDTAAIDENYEGTTVVGEWDQSQLIDLIRVLMTSGVELESARRFDTRSAGSVTVRRMQPFPLCRAATESVGVLATCTKANGKESDLSAAR